MQPTLSYHPNRDEYLLIYNDVTRGSKLLAKSLFTNGLPKGGVNGATWEATRSRSSGFGIDERGMQTDPALYFNSERDEYFLVWAEKRDEVTGFDIYGQRMFSNGRPVGYQVVIYKASGDQQHPDVVFGADNYLVVWDDNVRDVDEIYGIRLNVAGNPVGGAFVVVSGESNAQDPTVGPGERNSFQVAWVDDRNGNRDIYSKQVYITGIPAPGGRSQDRALVMAAEHDFDPDITTGFLVWTQARLDSGLDIMGLRVYPTGLVNGRPIGITARVADQRSPAAASNPQRGETLVVFSDNRSGDFDIFALRLVNDLPRGADYPVVSDR
jgi:hypothetical protein